MLAQLDNKILSSLLLHVDYKIQNLGMAYKNYSGLFYPIQDSFNGISVYAAPFKQLVNDVSISGANVMSGVYLNNHFVTIGQSGLVAINHYQSTISFSSALPKNTVISGNYAVKDFSVEITDQVEQNLLFATKYVLNNKYNQVLSGLSIDTKTCPSIFLKTKVQDSKPFALGGVDEATIRVRGIIVSDNEFNKIAVSTILNNLNYRPLPYIASTPFDSMGNMTGINYNYNNLPIDPSFKPWILSLRITDIPIQGEFTDVVKNMALMDVLIGTIKSHDF